MVTVANGSSKHGYAKADRFRLRRKALQDDVAEKLRRYRDSIDLEPEQTPEAPTVVVVEASTLTQRVRQSLRPIGESLRPIAARVWAKRVVLLVGAIALGAWEALQALGVLK